MEELSSWWSSLGWAGRYAATGTAVWLVLWPWDFRRETFFSLEQIREGRPKADPVRQRTAPNA